MSNFLARKKYLEIIRKRVDAFINGFRQNIAIIADESTGKTSLVLHFLKNFFDSRLITVYLEVKPGPADYFIRKFVGSLLYNFLKNSQIQLKEDLDYLILKSQNYIPQTISKINSLLKSKPNSRKENPLNSIFAICESINKETSKSCLIIFDEFHNLEGLGIRNLYKHWSKALISQKNTMYIILSSKKFKSRQILSKNLSLLFGNFETVEMDAFDTKESSEFINNIIHPLNLQKNYRDFLIHFSGGHPYYLKVICQEILKSSAGPGAANIIPEETLINSLKELLFDEMGTLNLRFLNYLKEFSADGLSQEYTQILYLISSGHNRTKDLTAALHKQRKYIQPKINRLVELDIIEQCGDFFKISDRVFSFWIRFVYKEKISTFSPHAHGQIEIFKDKIADMMKEFINDSSRPMLNRILEILQLFGNESLHINRKRIKLSQFREIKPLKFNGRSIKDGLLGRSSEDLWIIALKDEAITEEDVAEFTTECKKYKSNRAQKKIIVSTKNIDTNAYLKALEEKIITWDTDNLNFILDLFSKPRIIT